MKKYSLILIIFSLFISWQGYAQSQKSAADAEESAIDFKNTKFLQVDPLEIPPELKIIEDQIKQNAVDVIIHSRTHTPMYAQKRELGYTEAYKKFHGLRVQIYPIQGVNDAYSLNLFYYNWTTNKYDKKLTRRISKYNVLNELRFALYELLLGKKFVQDHRDSIEKQSFDRIQAVREAVNAQKKTEKLENLKKKKQREELIEREDIAKKKRKLLLREEKEKEPEKAKNPEAANNDLERKKKENDPLAQKNSGEEPSGARLKIDQLDDKKEKDKLSKKDKKILPKKEDEAPPEPGADLVLPDADIGINKSIPTQSSFYVFAAYFNDFSITKSTLLETETNLKYLGIGARYNLEEITKVPRGLRFNLRIGIPILKQKYKFPSYQAVESEIYMGNLLNYFQVFGGLDYAPNFFVNLPSYGEGLQVFENQFLWFKLGLGFKKEFNSRLVSLRLAYLRSIAMSSNLAKKFDGDRLIATAYYQHTKKHGFELSYQRTTLIGDFNVLSTGLLASYVYKFEN